MPPYFSGLVRPSRPSSPSRLNTWCAGNSSAASHSSTCGLISSSMKRFRVRRDLFVLVGDLHGSFLGRRRSGPGDAELHRPKCAPRRLVADGEAEGEHAAGVARVDQAVVEEHGPRCGRRRSGARRWRRSSPVSAASLRLVDRLALARRAFAHHDLHRAGGLLGAHHRGLRGRPGEDEARVEAAPAHAVVAGAERGAALDRDLRHRGVRRAPGSASSRA